MYLLSKNRYFGLSILKFGIYSRFLGGGKKIRLFNRPHLPWPWQPHRGKKKTNRANGLHFVQTAGFHKVGGQAASDLEAPIIPIQAVFFWGAASVFFLFSGVVGVVLGEWIFFVLSFYTVIPILDPPSRIIRVLVGDSYQPSFATITLMRGEVQWIFHKDISASTLWSSRHLNKNYHEINDWLGENQKSPNRDVEFYNFVLHETIHMGFETHLEFRFHIFFHAQNLRVIESIEGFSIGALGYDLKILPPWTPDPKSKWAH